MKDDKEYIRKQKNYIRKLQRELKESHELQDSYYEDLRISEQMRQSQNRSHERFLNSLRNPLTWLHWVFTSKKYKI